MPRINSRVTHNEKGAKPRVLHEEGGGDFPPRLEQSYIGAAIGETIGLHNYSSLRLDVWASAPYNPEIDIMQEAHDELINYLANNLASLKEKFMEDDDDAGRNASGRARRSPRK